MLRLTREVRFTIPLPPATEGVGAALNGLSGNLIDGPGVYFELQVTLEGDIHPESQYVENIKVIDGRVRRDAVSVIAQLLQERKYTLAQATMSAAASLVDGWSSARLFSVKLSTNPYVYCTVEAKDLNMVHLTQRFEFSAAHRLHNPAFDDVTNRSIFGKCNNPAGHGHNYEFEVTLAGRVDPDRRLIDVNSFTRIVNQTVVERFDHKHLNQQTAEFVQVIPSVENIARVIYGLLEPHFRDGTKLASVKVWETPKTFAEYSA